MNSESYSVIVLAILIGIILYYLCKKQKEEKWTLLNGSQQEWEEPERESIVCDTGFYDDECKFSAVNCAHNENSYFYNNN